MHKYWRWLLGAVAVGVVLAIGAPYAFIHFIDGPAPAKLSLPRIRSASAISASAADGGASGVDGTYHVGPGSEAGYRVTEVLIGQHTTAVGRTAAVWGTVTVSGTTVSAATVTVAMASVRSDQRERNAQFDGRIMDVARYPTATLSLTRPITLGTVPGVGATAAYTATGTLTMHGVSRAVTFALSAERTATGVDVLADIDVAFADWGITNPSVGGFVTTESAGTLEVLLALTKGAGNAAATGTGRPAGATAGATGGGGTPSPVTVPSTTVPKLAIPKG